MTTWKCPLCHSQCKTCNGPTENDCLSCQPTYTYLYIYYYYLVLSKFSLIDGIKLYLFQGHCFDICPIGTYGDSRNKTCKDCSTGCKMCSSFSDCTGCFPGKYLDRWDKKCRTTNRIGKYKDSLTATYELCHEGCTLCTEYSTCQQCTSIEGVPYYLHSEMYYYFFPIFYSFFKIISL